MKNDLLCVFIGLFLGATLAIFIISKCNKMVYIDYNIAHYDTKTGEFIMNEMPK